jgi:uncharacterized membrane protein YfcA
MKTGLFIALGIFTASFILLWVRAIRKWVSPTPRDYAVGLVTQFLDTLGIGSFATMSACYKVWGMVADEDIPGTMNVGSTLTGILEAFIYIAVVEVDVTTLVLMVAAATVGAWLGAGVVARWPRRTIQLGMGTALLVTASLGVMSQLRFIPGAGERLGLAGGTLALAVAINALLGALMTLGIGLFAPCMMATYLMGMSPRAVFPIMMGSTAFLGPVASLQFIRAGRYNLRVALGIAIGGIPGVLAAAFLVRSIPLTAVRWLVIGAVVYTAVMMLRSAAAENRKAETASCGRSTC